MKRLIQSLRTGDVEVVEAPCPVVESGHVLIRSNRSVISAGTERMLVEFGKAGLLEKARKHPDKVRQVCEKVRTDGLLTTIEAVRNKLDEPLVLGYCNVGTVLETGFGVDGLAVGDRVVSNGSHAETVCIANNLCAKIPDEVSDEAAVFTVLGAISLQGIRLAQPTLGEAFVVSGLGLVGLLAVQLLRAHGCRVLGLDFDAARLQLAQQFGAEVVDLSSGDPLAAAREFSRGRGMDGVIIAASTKSDEPVHQAAQMCRQRGRIVLIGATGLQLSRDDFYEKELSFQVSCSYGPGRYDPVYEEKGVDYPFGLVRWTEHRNFEAVLDMIAAGAVNPSPLVTHRFQLHEAADAYQVITGRAPSLGVLLEYPCSEERTDKEMRAVTVPVAKTAQHPGHASNTPTVAVLGAGNFARRTLIPAFRRNEARLMRVVSPGGVSAMLAARQHNIAEASSDVASVLEDPRVDAVAIATRHDSHAQLACEAMEHGKHIYLEKPLALNAEQLNQIRAAYSKAIQKDSALVFTAGFNRRFAPHVQKIRSLLADMREPKAFVITVNAGAIPNGHWAHDPAVGGGQVIGEACHSIDLLRHLCGHPVVSLSGNGLGVASSRRSDVASFTLEFADGSLGTVHYLANGHRAFPKERLEVFCGGRILQLENFRKLKGYGWPQFNRMNLRRQDKGHVAGVKAFLDAVSGKAPTPIPFEEMMEVTQVSFDVLLAINKGETIRYHRHEASRQAA